MNEIIDKADDFVREVFDKQLPEEYTFHDYEHTQYVRRSALKLAKLEGINGSDVNCLELASLFHDLGNIHGRTAHELRSSEIAEEWLRTNGVSGDNILKIKNLILSTNVEVEPKDKLEQIIRDADLSHLGSSEFQVLNKKLRDEVEYIKGEKFSDADWLQANVEFFAKHNYFTDSGNKLFSAQKEENLSTIKQMLNEQSISTGPIDNGSTKEKVAEKKKKKNKKKVLPDRPDKGIETMFRVTLRNHVQLSRLADNKANIMLSINAVVISVVLTSLLPKLDTNTFLQWPTFILLFVCIVSIIFATLSTIPNVTSGKADREQIAEKKVNLLFFGNFHDMELDDYTWGMNYMMNDREYLYNSLIKDLYFLGKVLNKKYKLLRITYAVFMIGIIIATLSFVIALLNF